MEYIISALWLALECVAFFLFASAFLPYRHNSKRTLLTALSICILFLLNQSLTLPALMRRLCALTFGLCLIAFFVSGSFGAAHLHRLAGLYLNSRDGCNCPFWRVYCFKNQFGRTGLEKRNVYRAGDGRKNSVRFPGVACHAAASVSQASSITSQMDVVCQFFPTDKSFYADGVIPDLQRSAGTHTTGGFFLYLSRHSQCGDRLCYFTDRA